MAIVCRFRYDSTLELTVNQELRIINQLDVRDLIIYAF
jgi:hypothetical protein